MDEARLTRKSRRWIIALVSVLGTIAAVVIWLGYHFSPILQRQAIAMLSDRFDSEIELEDFHASLWNLKIHGGGLVIRHHGRRDVPPLIRIDKFAADADLMELFGKKWHVHKIEVHGLQLAFPPKDKREGKIGVKGRDIPVAVDRFIADDTQLILISSKPGKDPHTFDIHHLEMQHLGLGRAASFETTLTNATPPGEIRSVGQWGPWNKDDPRTTHLRATYTFSNADLSVFKGISGILSSEGDYEGPLDNLEVKGKTNIPDFAVTIAGHKVNLTTDFHAIVDGSNGDTLLYPVVAHFLNTALTCNGGVVKAASGKGRMIKLHVTSADARLEDLMALAVKANQPPMTGAVNLDTNLELPPGPKDISDRLILGGKFHIRDGRFTKSTVRDKIRDLSRRGLGKPKDEEAGSDKTELAGTFTLDNGVLTFRDLTFEVSGAKVHLNGTYALNKETFDLHGKLHLQAKLSQTMTGVKSFVMKAVDPFFRKNGETVVPIKITGNRDHPSFGLDL
jgi:hypothetical protein